MILEFPSSETENWRFETPVGLRLTSPERIIKNWKKDLWLVCFVLLKAYKESKCLISTSLKFSPVSTDSRVKNSWFPRVLHIPICFGDDSFVLAKKSNSKTYD